MKLPSVSEIERQIRDFRSMIPRLRRADGVLGGTRGATCTIRLWIQGDEVLVGDATAEIQHTHTGYGSEVVPRLGVAFDVKAAARRLHEAATRGTSSDVQEPDWRVAEGVSGTWHYHVRDVSLPHALSQPAPCGAHVMQTEIPLSAWGTRGHLKEKWCAVCAAHAGIPTGKPKP